MVERGAQALEVLKEYDYELGILEVLLEQKIWRRGRRGRWHERKAVILMKRSSEAKGGKAKESIWREALTGITNALLDEYTGIGRVSLLFMTHMIVKANFTSVPLSLSPEPHPHTRHPRGKARNS